MNILERACRSFLKRRGYAVSRTIAGGSDEYALVKYDNNGKFDYDRYVNIQTAGNRAKLKNVWADEETITLICNYLQSSGIHLKQGLCHGSRNGTEVRWFSEKLGIPVIGTDISDTAEQFGLVEWDFHKPRDDWRGRFDFIYTNSHDHAHDPKTAFTTWVEQLAPNGKLLIEHTMAHSVGGVTELDPWGVDPHLFPYVLLAFADGRFAVTRVLKPLHKKHNSPIWVFVVEANPASNSHGSLS